MTGSSTWRNYVRSHPKTSWTAGIVLGLAAVLVIATALFDWNLLRPALERRISAATGRQARIRGDLKVHLWSWNPRGEVDDVSLANPPWAKRNTMFAARSLTVSVSLLHLLRGQIVVPELKILGPDIDLERDARGRASWDLGTKAGTPKATSRPAKLPAIQRLVIDDGKLNVSDAIRKLTFAGSLVAADVAGRKDPAAFKIRCTGTLNDKPFKLSADGGPLVEIEPTKPYSFAVRLSASDIDLESHVTVRKPFDLGAIDMKFQVSGRDLADVYYLTGLALPNTPPYRLAADVHLQGTDVAVDGLKGTLGTSDIEGRGEVQNIGVKPKLVAKLRSGTLSMADLEPTLGEPERKPDSLSAAPGAKASPPAGDKATAGGTPPAPDSRLLPDSNLQVNRVRGMDADVTYHADSVTMPKVPMKEVNFHLVLKDGVLRIDPLSFFLDRGKFSGVVQIDARPDVPVSDIDMHIDDIDLSQFRSAAMKQSPLDGKMLGRFQLHGTGASVHKFAASSAGIVSVVIPDGQISDVIAELTGINVLKGLGLLLSSAQPKTEIRCGIMDFKDTSGTLHTTTVFVDTSDVLITGRGDIDLQTEKLNLALQGDPKKIRLLRLRSPITLHGTLLHPAIGINAGKLAEQAGVAAALGALLTPVAAALAFVDPGLAKNKDCSDVLAQARAGVSQPASTAGAGSGSAH